MCRTEFHKMSIRLSRPGIGSPLASFRKRQFAVIKDPDAFLEPPGTDRHLLPCRSRYHPSASTHGIGPETPRNLPAKLA